MRKFLLATVALVSIGVGAGFATNYTMTQGAGTTFGSLVVSAVNYAQQLICDPTTPTQCQAVSAGGAASVSAAQSGTWNVTNISGTVALPTGAATSANQATEITSLASIVTNTAAPIPTQAPTVNIGAVGISQTTPGTTNGVQVIAALPTGAAVIGKVGVDQTTPGTTNGVSLIGVNAATALAGAGAVGTGSARVAVGQDTTTIAGSAPGTAGTPSANVVSVQGIAGGLPNFASTDPCAQSTKSGGVINLTASGQIITGTAAKKTYICAIDVVVTTAGSVALVEGTGTVCATNIFGLAGGTTAATGWNFAATSGIARGAGSGTVYSPSADTNGTAANVCLLLSGTGQTSGQISYVQQ